MEFQITDLDARGDLDPLIDEVFALLAARGPRCGNHALITIDGRSGAGKTDLARALAASLNADLLHLEDMYQGWQGLLATVALVRERLISPLARGEAAAVPTWDWLATSAGLDRPVRPGQLLLLEGVGAFGIGAAFDSVRIWVQAPQDLRRERALARDGSAYAPWWDTWADQEERYLASALDGAPIGPAVADIVVRT